ncbi:regulator of chromosome condensation 1/beta-lactamase-inhibitor protein II, partial [Coniella lustricola]
KKKSAAIYGQAPIQPLHVFAFGEGSAGELGLGVRKVEGKKPLDVKRPRKNVLLACDTARVVQIACGGMHSVALTKDNRLLTWGVNDQGALGRDTQWDGGLRDMDVNDDGSSSDSEADDDCGLNPLESSPGEVDMRSILPGEVFIKVAATDSASFALTQGGRLYSWGTYRASDGILGFNKDVETQDFPILLPEPTKIVDIATGSNHVVAISAGPKSKVLTWGAAEQNQLGRRVVERNMRSSALHPGVLAFKRGVSIRAVACGSYHSFAIDTTNKVWAWGLNNFGQLGVETAGAGEDDAMVLKPTLVEALAEYDVAEMYAGEHHSLARTTDGRLLTFGRVDSQQTGLPQVAFTEANCIFDDRGSPRILAVPTAVDIQEEVVFAAAGTDTTLAITADGKAYSWGFNANYQCGLGNDNEIETPTLIDNSAIRDQHLRWAGAGGQFGLLASFA